MEFSKIELSTIENSLAIYQFMLKNRLKDVRKNINLYNEDYLLYLENELLTSKHLLKIIYG